jgi:hypothetical protein
MFCKTGFQIIVVALGCFVAAAQFSSAGPPPDPQWCLLQWERNIEKMDTCSYSVKTTSDSLSLDGKHRYGLDQTDWVRCNDGRYSSTTDRWGNVSAAFVVSDRTKFYRIRIVNRPGLGELQLLELDERRLLKASSPMRLTVCALPLEQAETLRHGSDGSLDGYWLDITKPVPTYLLSHLSKIAVRYDSSRGTPCIVLEDKNEFGRCQFWLDPLHGYNPAYFEINSSAGDLSADEIRSTRIPYAYTGSDEGTLQVIHESTVGTDFSYILVGDTWVTSKCSVESRVDFASQPKGLQSRCSLERTNVNFHPDFTRAFDLKIPNQTPFFRQNPSGVRYVWQDGAVVPRVDDATVHAIDAVVRSAQTTQPSSSK